MQFLVSKNSETKQPFHSPNAIKKAKNTHKKINTNHKIQNKNS